MSSSVSGSSCRSLGTATATAAAATASASSAFPVTKGEMRRKPRKLSAVQQPVAVGSLRQQGALFRGLRGAVGMRVSSALEDLQRLHEATGWTPSAEQIRPNPTVRAQKELMLTNLEQMWVTLADVLSHQVFGMATTRGADGRRSAARPAHTEPPRLVPQPFPYDLPAGTEHMVLWCPAPEHYWSEAAITAAIARGVEARWGGGDFVWCPHPGLVGADPDPN